MRSPLFLTPQPWTLLVLLAFGCTSKDSEDDTSTAIDCSALTANAGPDQAIGVGDTVTLDGSGSVVCLTDGRTYTWSFESTPTDSAIDESALSDNKSATATSVEFTPDIAGDYVLARVVSDGEENSGSDIVVISVSSTDSAPIADCGGDKAGKRCRWTAPRRLTPKAPSSSIAGPSPALRAARACRAPASSTGQSRWPTSCRTATASS